jgi:ribonucleoside-diphosphate reductase alpha chain
MQSWKQGLKGITVYRDGSRTGVLVSDSEIKAEVIDQIMERPAPQRPATLQAEVIRFKNEQEDWIAFVGLLNGKPYEIFTGKAEDAFRLPDYVTKGWIIKTRNAENVKRYDFQFTDKEGYKITIEGLSRSFNKEYWNYAKLISGILRHGMPLHNVVDLISGLNLYSDNINTWKNGLERALKKFIPDGTAAPDHKCPNCNDPSGLIYEEGCLKCKSCGFSKCG